jgi:spoIIIJ-associated protein
MTESNEIETPEEDELDEGDAEDEGDTEDEVGEGEGTAEATDGQPRKRKRRRRRRPSDDEPVLPADDQAARALGFLTEVVEQMELDCRVQLRRAKDPEDRDIHIEITGNDTARVIGKRGQTLSALQLLASRVLNRAGQERRYVSVDAEGYRSRRDDSLAAMAKRLGKQAISDGKIITFEPMSPRDRRVVHLALAKFDGVITKSDGEGEDRRVQIIPVRRGMPAAN